jgi:NAD(P)-dependent dehydrogenase (short-subunit alcohol dehydrogenase family)
MAPDRLAALVTGSASGIGRAAALRLARAGYHVAINCSRSEDTARHTLAELESLSGRHLALRADISDDDAVASLATAVGETYGRLMERRAAWTPMKRNVTEEDVAETIFSLITSNPFVTGETIVIDGGDAATT